MKTCLSFSPSQLIIPMCHKLLWSGYFSIVMGWSIIYWGHVMMMKCLSLWQSHFIIIVRWSTFHKRSFHYDGLRHYGRKWWFANPISLGGEKINMASQKNWIGVATTTHRLFRGVTRTNKRNVAGRYTAIVVSGFRRRYCRLHVF